MKATKSSYPYLGLSGKKIYAAQSQQKDFLLVGTEIDFMVTNYNICPDGALICGALQMKGFVYTQYGKIYMFFLPTLDGLVSIL